MKPISVVHVDPERGFSGGESQVLALMRHLRERGHGGLLAGHPGGPLAERAARAGIAVAELACRGSHDPRAGLRLRRLVAREAPDVVHFHTARALSLAPYLGPGTVRVVTRRMDYPPRGARGYVRWLYGHVDGVIAISHAVRAALGESGVARESVAVVPSGVEVARFRTLDSGATARRKLGIAPDKAVIAIVASLHARKGHAVLLRAIARLAVERLRPICLIAGGGPERHGLADLAADLGLADRVRWLGQVDDVREVLWAADLVAMPSFAEGLGVAAIEAMAAARPVIASAVGGLPELVREGVEGLLVPPGDDVALAGALGRCLRDPELCRRLGAGAEVRAADFSTEAMARGNEAVYERLLERLPRRAGSADDGATGGPDARS